MTLLKNALLRCYSTQARTPMIKFRKGGAATGATGSGQGHGSAVSGAAPKSKISKKSGSQQTVIVGELPARFQRQPISEEEIEYINRGGPA